MATNKSTMSKEQKAAERLKYWRINRGAHKLKNRSSKNILSIHHYNPNKVWKSFSNDVLQKMAKNESYDAQQELNRRARKRDKKEGLTV